MKTRHLLTRSTEVFSGPGLSHSSPHKSATTPQPRGCNYIWETLHASPKVSSAETKEPDAMETLWSKNWGNTPEFGELQPVWSSRSRKDPWDGWCQVWGWDFLSLWIWGLASSTSLQGRRALVCNSWPWDGTWDLWSLRFQRASRAAGPALGYLLQAAPKCGPGKTEQQHECWALMESWHCDSLTGTGTSPATIPETHTSCYQQQNRQDHRFLGEAAASGEQISFRKRCVLMCQKQSFLGFSGSCEVKRKACFKLRGKKKKPTTVFCHLETLGV